MKRKTLLVLLGFALIISTAFFIYLLINSIGYFRAYGVYSNTYAESKNSGNAYWYDFDGNRITASKWIYLITMRYLLKPLLFLVGSCSLVFILLYLIIGVVKRRPLILNKDEQYTIEQRQSDNLQEEPVNRIKNRD